MSMMYRPVSRKGEIPSLPQETGAASFVDSNTAAMGSCRCLEEMEQRGLQMTNSVTLVVDLSSSVINQPAASSIVAMRFDRGQSNVMTGMTISMMNALPLADSPCVAIVWSKGMKNAMTGTASMEMDVLIIALL